MNESTLSWIYQVMKLHNLIRHNYSLPLFIFNQTLMDLAKLQCQEMYTQNKVFHDHVVLRGGQNILCSTNKGYYYFPQKLIDQWLNHLPHRNILLNPFYQHIGSFALLSDHNNNYFVSNYN
jgi:uncharacterized protein YkwD